MELDNQPTKNVTQSIILTGPCGVGKSLISQTLAHRTNLPRIDIDGLLAHIGLSYNRILSSAPQVQQAYIRRKVDDALYSGKKPTPIERDCQVHYVQEFVDMHNHYDRLLGGFDRFYQDFVAFRSFCFEHHSNEDSIYALNKFTYKMLTKIFATTTTPLIISAPGTFGWHDPETTDPAVVRLQSQISQLLRQTRNVFLHPGEDYDIRRPANTKEPSHVNSLLMQHPEYYHANADLVIATNGLFTNPENKCFQQRDLFNLTERLTKNKLKNQTEIDNICDQIMEYLGDDFTKQPVESTDTLSK